MKKIIKPLFCYLCAVMVLFSCVFFATPVNASGLKRAVFVEPMSMSMIVDYPTYGPYGDPIDNMSDGHYQFVYYVDYAADLAWEQMISNNPTFTYISNGMTWTAYSMVLCADASSPSVIQSTTVAALTFTSSFVPPSSEDIRLLTDYLIQELGGYYIVMQTTSPQGGLYALEDVSLYDSAWDIFKQYIYGDGEMSPEQHLVLTLLATLIALAVVLLPFFIVWWIIRLVASLMR